MGAFARSMAWVTVDQMRAIDRVATEKTGPSLLQMMENAGRSLAVLVLRTVGHAIDRASVLVVAGRGGNGGGGIAAARHLSTRVERVDLWLPDPDDLAPVTREQLLTYAATPGRLTDVERLRTTTSYDVVVDAVIGYGLRGAPTGAAKRAIEWMDSQPAPVIALDVPSGLDPDTGATPGVCVLARATLTLHLPKHGLKSASSGEVFVADLGIPPGATRKAGIEPPLYGPDFIVPLES